MLLAKKARRRFTSIISSKSEKNSQITYRYKPDFFKLSRKVSGGFTFNFLLIHSLYYSPTEIKNLLRSTASTTQKLHKNIFLI
jgi:hypothetical protein